MPEVSRANSLAIFDLDNTLLDGDCEYLWCEFLSANGQVDAGFVQQIQQYFVEYDAGTVDFAAYEKFLLSGVVGLPEEELCQLMLEFQQQLQQRLRPWMVQRLEFHQARGDTILLATASNSMLVMPVARLLGIDNVLCTRIEMQGEVPTGRLLGNPLFREEKAKSIQFWIEMRALSLSGSWAYSDSWNDLPILLQADNPVAVTPDATLRAYAIQNGWLILENELK